MNSNRLINFIALARSKSTIARKKAENVPCDPDHRIGQLAADGVLPDAADLVSDFVRLHHLLPGFRNGFYQ
ncbi:MAG: hypothetical protein OQL06_12315 [Gammaproteobacteria bacterium]|nr:hypothetical protein [Gammaproteobacteria bacterium]